MRGRRCRGGRWVGVLVVAVVCVGHHPSRASRASEDVARLGEAPESDGFKILEGGARVPLREWRHHVHARAPPPPPRPPCSAYRQEPIRALILQ